MNTLFKLRKAAMVVVAGLAAVFMVAGCKGDDGDGVGGGNASSTASLTGVSIKGTSEIAADGASTLTATPVYTGEIASQITYKWEITSGSKYAELSPTNVKTVTISGKNTASEKQSVTVKVTASYNGITKIDTHPITVAAKGVPVENELTGLEIVTSASSVACTAFAANWGRNTERDGENRAAYGLSFPCTRSHSTIAAAMAEVIPHLLKPVTANRPVVPAEYWPI